MILKIHRILPIVILLMMSVLGCIFTGQTAGSGSLTKEPTPSRTGPPTKTPVPTATLRPTATNSRPNTSTPSLTPTKIPYTPEGEPKLWIPNPLQSHQDYTKISVTDQTRLVLDAIRVSGRLVGRKASSNLQITKVSPTAIEFTWKGNSGYMDVGGLHEGDLGRNADFANRTPQPWEATAVKVGNKVWIITNNVYPCNYDVMVNFNQKTDLWAIVVGPETTLDQARQKVWDSISRVDVGACSLYTGYSTPTPSITPTATMTATKWY